MAATSDRFFSSDGVRIHYTDEGQGEPVLLIHGVTLGIERNWREPGVIPGLAKQYRVIAMDCRGHGKSDKPHDPRAYGKTMAEDVVRLLDHLQIEKAHIVGYSMGGRILLKLLATHPGRVRTATLGGSAGTREGANPALFERTAADLESGRGLQDFIIALKLTGEPEPTEARVRELNDRLLAGNDAKALAAVLHGYPDLAVSDAALRANTVPTLALVGSEDPVRGEVERLAGLMPGLEVVVLEGADHATAFERPEFVAELRKLLARDGSSPAKK